MSTKTREVDESPNGEQAPKAEKKLYERLDKSLKELERRANGDQAGELAERCRKLANMVAAAAAHQVVDIRTRQRNNEPVDPRELTSPSLALEKVTKAVEAYTKHRQASVDMQSRLVAGEVEAVKTRLRDPGDKDGDLKKRVYKHEIGKPSKAPVLQLLKGNKLKRVSEMTEEEKANQYADQDPDSDQLPGEVAEYSSVQEDLHSGLDQDDQGRSEGLEVQGDRGADQVPHEE